MFVDSIGKQIELSSQYRVQGTAQVGAQSMLLTHSRSRPGSLQHMAMPSPQARSHMAHQRLLFLLSEDRTIEPTRSSVVLLNYRVSWHGGGRKLLLTLP